MIVLLRVSHPKRQKLPSVKVITFIKIIFWSQKISPWKSLISNHRRSRRRAERGSWPTNWSFPQQKPILVKKLLASLSVSLPFCLLCMCVVYFYPHLRPVFLLICVSLVGSRTRYEPMTSSWNTTELLSFISLFNLSLCFFILAQHNTQHPCGVLGQGNEAFEG